METLTAGMLRRRGFVAALFLAPLVLAAMSCGGNSSPEASPDVVVVIDTPASRTTPRPRRTGTVTPSPTASPLTVCAANPDPASPKVLQLLEPQPNAQVRVPFHVRGWGSNIGFQERGVALAIVDAKQNVVQVLDLPPQPRDYRVVPSDVEITEFTKPFAADVVISNVKEPTPFCLWVYQETTETGRPKGVVQVPVLVVP